MRRTMMTKFGTSGNCYSACWASLLEIPIEDVPDFEDHIWQQQTAEFLLRYGLSFFMTSDVQNVALSSEQIVIGGGKGPRNPEVYHACLYKPVMAGEGELDWELVHDPHPSGDGIEGELQFVMVAVPADPAAYVRAR